LQDLIRAIRALLTEYTATVDQLSWCDEAHRWMGFPIEFPAADRNSSLDALTEAFHKELNTFFEASPAWYIDHSPKSPHWKTLSECSWRICDLSRKIHFALGDFPSEPDVELAKEGFYEFVRGVHRLLLDETRPDDAEDFFKLRTACGHVMDRIKNLRAMMDRP
jgi:hypothetical protein